MISLEFAAAIKIPITLQRQTIGTAAAGGTVEVIGRAKSFIMFLEGIPRPIVISPIVVKQLAHTVNLGQAFLRRNSAALSFGPEGGQLHLQGLKIPLQPPQAPILRPSADSKFQKTIDRIQAQRSAEPKHAATAGATSRVAALAARAPVQHPLVLAEEAELRLRAAEPIFIPQGGMITATLYCDNPESALSAFPHWEVAPVFVTGHEVNANIAELGLLVMPGIYTLQGNRVRVHVRNLSDIDRIIPETSVIAYGSASEPMPTINALSHKEPELLTPEELAERKAFLIKSLKLNESPYLRDDRALQEKLMALLLDNFDAISIDDNDFGKTNLVRFRIDLKPGTEPHKARVRPLNPMQEKDLRRQLDTWLDAKIIEPTVSSWGSALVPVRKKGTDKLRWAIDYRYLNDATIKDSFPLALIDSNLQKLGGAKVFSTLDSAGAFHNLVVDPDCRDYTTFNSAFGQFRFVRLPFGVANGPAAYSRLVQIALDKITPGAALGYLDDIICYSPDPQSHFNHLAEVIRVHTECGMKLKLSKCRLFADEVEYLGHLVSAKGIRMIPSYVEKVINWTLPATGADLRSFLGFAGYYRTFIRDFASLTADMNKFRQVKGPVIWTDQMRNNFEQLKRAFADAPVRGYPDYKNPNPFILDTDFSHVNMAAVLSQIQDGQEVFLGCCAKKCSATEANYPSWKGELAAVILGINKFEHILLARRFLLRTDNSAVTYLKNLKECRGMIGRWKMRLASFDFELQHRAGTKQVNADSLSRMPGLPPSAELDELVVPEEDQDVLDVYALRNLPVISPSKDLPRATAQDPDLRMLVPFLRAGQRPDALQSKAFSYIGSQYLAVFECLRLRDGVIYFHSPTDDTKVKICLPVALFGHVFAVGHSSAAAGHLGKTKTRDRILSRFFAPGLSAYIQSRISLCTACILKRNTITSDKPVQHTKHQEPVNAFNRKVYVDTVGPFNPASRVNGRLCRHYLSILDGYTRYLVCVPIPDLETRTIAEAFVNHYALNFGLPTQIHSDNGTSFVSELFSRTCELLGIHKTETPIYSPEGNRVERVHRLLGEVIRSFPEGNYAEWGDRLRYAVFAYNTSWHRKLGMSPYEALFGVPPRIPLDLVYPTPPPVSPAWDDFCLYLKNRCQYTFQKVLQHNGQTGLNLAPLGVPTSPYKVGDQVYYFLNRITTGVSAKLRTRWIGPFEITRIISPSLVIIKPLGSWAANPRELAAIASRIRRVLPDRDAEPLSWDGQPVDLERVAPPDSDLDLFVQISSSPGFSPRAPTHWSNSPDDDEDSPPFPPPPLPAVPPAPYAPQAPAMPAPAPLPAPNLPLEPTPRPPSPEAAPLPPSPEPAPHPSSPDTAVADTAQNSPLPDLPTV